MSLYHILVAVVMVFAGVGNVSGAQIPAMFVFGDSLFDPGNNNHYKTLAKANYPPNGIDFPAGFTGRFCNGATIADHLGFLLGFGLIPSVNDPNTQGSNILQGVNFASSSAGILNYTGKEYGQSLSMYQQIENFQSRIIPGLGSQVLSINGEVVGIKDYLANSLFISNMGNNDFLNNYLLPFSNPFQKPIPPNFNDILISAYIIHVENLYNYGARKFFVTGLAPLGCLPAIIGFYSRGTNQCYEPYNKIAIEFNRRLELMIWQLRKQLPLASFLFWDVYVPFRQVIDNPSQYGFKYAHIACCGAGPDNGLSLCIPGVFLCLDRSEFIFWDAFHSTDAANKLIANIAYEGTAQGTYPSNLKQLLHL